MVTCRLTRPTTVDGHHLKVGTYVHAREGLRSFVFNGREVEAPEGALRPVSITQRREGKAP